ncbi:MAG: YfhH family protein [Sporolactobacillus sp.]
MEKRFSEMTPSELATQIGRFTDHARKAEQMGMINEFLVYERKIDMAKAYLMDPASFHPGETYLVDDQPFTIDYMKGNFAWGKFLNGDDQQHAYPISLLKRMKKQTGSHQA